MNLLNDLGSELSPFPQLNQTPASQSTAHGSIDHNQSQCLANQRVNWLPVLYKQRPGNKEAKIGGLREVEEVIG